MKYLSLFSGIGGFEYGLQMSDYTFTNVGFSEIDKYAKSVYQRHYPNHPDLGDAREIDPKGLQDFDLLVGGFPCQAFSLSGKRCGFDDTRGTLFFEIARICEEKKPRYLLLENVKGLLSHDKGRTFKKILGVLSELGYDVEWEILNSKSFGVAQSRERLYIKGYFRAKCGREILSAKRDSRKANVQGIITHKFQRQVRKRVNDVDYKELSSFLRNHKKESGLSNKAIAAQVDKPVSEVEHWFRRDDFFAPPTDDVWLQLKEILGIESDKYDDFMLEFEWVDGVFEQDKRAYGSDGLSPTLTTKGESLVLDSEVKVLGSTSPTNHWGKRVYDKDGLSPTLCSQSLHKNGVRVQVDNPKINVVGNVGNTGHNGENVLDSNGISSTLTANNYKHPVKIIETDVDVEKVFNTTREFNGSSTDGTYVPTLTASMRTGGGNVPMMKLKTNTEKGYDEVETGDGVRLCHPSSTKARGRTQKGQTGALSTSADWGTVERDYRIRRLTPKECERLQAFPSITEKIEIWLSEKARRNVQFVVEKWHKNQKLVGSVENNKLQKNVLSVEKNSQANDPQTKKLVLQNVQINSVGKQIQLFNHERLNSSVNNVEKKNGYLQYTRTEDFAQLIVGMSTILEKIIQDGKVESLLKGQVRIHQENGKTVVKLFGEEMMPLVNSVGENLTIEKELMKFITSDLSNMKNLGSMLTTLYCYVIGVIIGSIPTRTDTNCLEKIDFNISVGWSEVGVNGEFISDTQRYKCLGNAVTTSVVTYIANNMFRSYFESKGTD